MALLGGLAISLFAPLAAADGAEDARARFARGLEKFEQGSYVEALADFQASRAVLENKSAARNAALCLMRLERYDEALDTFEELLALPTLTEDERREAATMISDLSKRVGAIDVIGTDGATVVVDGRERGTLPLAHPLRATAGTHVVRVIRAGFAPFESRVDVEAGRRRQVSASLAPLARSGVLRVEASSGAEANVVIDRVARGRTPFESPIEPGPHAVWLTAPGGTGAPPTLVVVRAGETHVETLTVGPLPAALRIEVRPATASVYVDDAPLGEGAWEGRLATGRHVIEVVHDGYHPARREVSLDGHDLHVVRVKLDPTVVPTPPDEGPSGHFTLEASWGLPLSPSLGGPMSDACETSCERSLAIGFDGRVIGGYQLANGVGLGIYAGGATLAQSRDARPSSLTPVGKPANAGAVNDDVRVSGFRLGGLAGITFGSSVRAEGRVGVGILVGSVSDTRTGRFFASTGGEYDAGRLADSDGVTLLVLEPEVRVGWPLGEALLASIGLGVPIGYALSSPRWTDTQPLSAGDDGLAQYEEEALLASWLVAFSPSIALRLAL